MKINQVQLAVMILRYLLIHFDIEKYPMPALMTFVAVVVEVNHLSNEDVIVFA